jgi:hypothetical protein
LSEYLFHGTADKSHPAFHEPSWIGEPELAPERRKPKLKKENKLIVKYAAYSSPGINSLIH